MKSKTIESLPSDLFYHILSFLTREDIIKFRRVSKKTQNLIDDPNEELWKILCLRDAYNTTKLSPLDCVGYKKFYLQFEGIIEKYYI